MKTALILYGFFRTFNFCKQSLKESILDSLSPDVFFSTPKTIWANKQLEVSDYHNRFSINDDLVNNDIINFFGDKLKKYNLIDYDNKKYLDLVLENNFSDKNFVGQYSWRIFSFAHNYNLSINLFKDYVEKNNINYDMVIVTRPDVRYYSPFFSDKIELHRLNFPMHFMLEFDHHELSNLNFDEKKEISNRLRKGAAGVFGHNRTFNDQIVVGNQENILKYSNLFDSVIEYAKEGTCINQETFLGVHALKNNIEFGESDFIHYELWRLNQSEY